MPNVSTNSTTKDEKIGKIFEKSKRIILTFVMVVISFGVISQIGWVKIFNKKVCKFLKILTDFSISNGYEIY